MVAAMIVTLGAAAHVVGGGELPVPGIMLAVLALTGMAATAATRLRLNFPAMAALLGAGQLVLHEAFSAFSSPAGTGACKRAGASPGGPVTGRIPAGNRRRRPRAPCRFPLGRLPDAGRACPGHPRLRAAARQGRGRPLVPRRVAPAPRSTSRSGNARRRRGTCRRRLAGGFRAAPLAQPQAGLQAGPACRRRSFTFPDTFSWLRPARRTAAPGSSSGPVPRHRTPLHSFVHRHWRLVHL